MESELAARVAQLDAALAAALARLDAMERKLDDAGDVPHAGADIVTLRPVLVEADDHRAQRRDVLRRARARFYRGQPRTSAAMAMALDWRAYVGAHRNAPPDPETLDAVWHTLASRGVKPIAWRQIADDLDPVLDKPVRAAA